MSYTKAQVEQFLQDLYDAKENSPNAYLPSVWVDVEKQIKAKIDSYEE
tara:strand:- start:56 stop:199 length:144 start_codon:yes stop_codon:yes gene_type:complete